LVGEVGRLQLFVLVDGVGHLRGGAPPGLVERKAGAAVQSSRAHAKIIAKNIK
jgi:hypothetical protein